MGGVQAKPASLTGWTSSTSPAMSDLSSIDNPTVSISQVYFEHHTGNSAIGIGESTPRISWRFAGTAKDWEQSSYTIEITDTTLLRSAEPIISTVNSSQSLLVPWTTVPLRAGQSASIRVKAQGQSEQPATSWSSAASVEAGLLDVSDWQNASFIAIDAPPLLKAPHPPTYLRRPFSLTQEPIRARLYITALGLYEAHINGERVGDEVLTPGWQSYESRVVYNTYDVTSLLQKGDNVLGTVVGEGWYAGVIGFQGNSNVYGDTPGMMSLLVVKFADGTQQVVKTDKEGDWKAGYGPIKFSAIYDGETYDANVDIQGWTKPGFDGRGEWTGVKVLPALTARLVAPDGPPVRVVEERDIKEVLTSPLGKTIVDFGQNLVGWARIRVDGPKGHNITLKHVEVLENGEIATKPLRSAKATDTLTLSGNGPIDWQPTFTFHGFRYLQIEGWPSASNGSDSAIPIDKNSVTAMVVHTDLEQTGWLETSHEMLNKLHENVRWSMKGNFLSIPTDCPQRDERLGWTGDAHAFTRTANYLYDTAGFWRSWLRDVQFEQMRGRVGVVPDVVPDVFQRNTGKRPVAIWGDVAVANPWQNYISFGDIAMLHEAYPSSEAWLDIGIQRNPEGLWDRTTFQYGDWLDPTSPPDNPALAKTNKHLVADAYLVGMTDLMTSITTELGLSDKAATYRADHTRLKKEFQTAWMNADGILANETQTAHTLTFWFSLFPSTAASQEATNRFASLITSNDFKVGTGFAGTHLIGHALSLINKTPLFYKMLLQTDVPSWLFQVRMGATTTWERWDSMLANGSVNPGEMTSFNHYAVGSVAGWMHAVIGGVKPVVGGWKRFRVEPVPYLEGGVEWAKARYRGGYGDIVVEWSVEEDKEKADAKRFSMRVEVPPNSKAEVVVPGGADAVVVGSGVYVYDVPYTG